MGILVMLKYLERLRFHYKISAMIFIMSWLWFPFEAKLDACELGILCFDTILQF